MGRGRAHEHREKLVGFLKNLGPAVIATEGEMDWRVCGVGWGLGVAADHEGGRWFRDESQLVNSARSWLEVPTLRRFEILMSQLAWALQDPNSNFVLFMSNGSVVSAHPKEIKTNHFSARDTS